MYAICDGNVAYQIHFLEAIRRGWLAPFHYYGVYDETDYSQIRWLGSHYNEEQLAAARLRTSQAEQIYRAWQRHKQTRTIGFCSSIRQANFLASYFVEAGVAAIALHSSTVGMSREGQCGGWRRGSLGSFSRWTCLWGCRYSGGGDAAVREADGGADGVHAADRAGASAVRAEVALYGDRLQWELPQCGCEAAVDGGADGGDGKKAVAAIPTAPAGCALELETAVVNLFEELSRNRMPLRDRLDLAFIDLRNELGRCLR